MENEIAWPTWDEVLDWARSFPPDEEVGRTGIPESCVLARCLHDKYPDRYFYINAGGPLPDYFSTFTPLGFCPPSHALLHDRIPLPDAANEIAVAFDEHFPIDKPVSAKGFVAAFTDPYERAIKRQVRDEVD